MTEYKCYSVSDSYSVVRRYITENQLLYNTITYTLHILTDV